MHFALASYNAGPLRLKEWVSRYKTTDPILFIDLIPFRETRDYVASVLKNYFWYRELYAKNTETTSIVSGAFPADALALNQLHNFDLTPSPPPAPPIAATPQTPAQTPVTAPVAKASPKPKESKPEIKPEVKSESKPELVEAEKPLKTAKDVESDITEMAKKEISDEKDKVGPELPKEQKQKEDDDALPGEISIAPEIDRGQPK